MIGAWLVTGLLWASGPCEHQRLRFNCVRFVRAIDGDTILVDLPGVHPFFGEGTKVRVMGVDTPETHGQGPCEKDWARVAKGLVQTQLRDVKRIDLVLEKKADKYGRPLARVLYDGKDLKEVLLKNHLAVPYLGKKKARVDWCKMSGLAKNRPRT